ncbi:oxygenase MpaB family protein [Pseudomonadota bacterium]
MSTEQWSNAFLDTYRNTGDHRADAVIKSLEESQELSSVNDALEHLDSNDQALPSDLPKIMVDYLNDTAELPEWADMDKIAIAEKFFSSRGPLFGVVLLCGSLPTLYAGGQGGAQVLMATQQFTKHYGRRAGETLRFILDVLEPNGLAPGGKGLRTVQKVRLMHAAIRYYARKSPEAWPAKPNWGQPINQEEMTGTFLAFSTKALDDIAKLGVDICEEEQEAYFHTWKVAAHLLGIEPEMVPATRADAASLWSRIAERNFMRTKDGVALAECHVDFLKKVIPGHLVDGMAVSLMRYLMGRKMTEQYLGLPHPGWTYVLITFVRGLLGLEEILLNSTRTLAEIIEHDSILFMEGLDKLWMEGDTTPFRIPPSLTQK